MKINNIRTLLMMQLKDKVDLSFTKNKKTLINKIVLSLLLFLIITVLIYLFLFLMKNLNVFSLSNYIPSTVIGLIFSFIFIISIIQNSFKINNLLYFSNDNMVLLTLPIKVNELFLSKIILSFIFELKKNILYIFPLFIAYGILSKFQIYYYIWLIIMLIILTILAVLISSALSIIIMYLKLLFKKIKTLKIVFILSIIFITLFISLKIINLIPEDIDLYGSRGQIYFTIQDFLEKFSNNFKIIMNLIYLIIGRTYGRYNKIFDLNNGFNFLYLILFQGLLFILLIFIIKPTFKKMINKNISFKKQDYKQLDNKSHNKYLSHLKKDFLISIRNQSYFTNIITVFLLLPILLFLLNKIYSAFSTRVLGDNLTLAFTYLMILLIVLSSNGYLATSLSREGKTLLYNYQNPINNKFVIISKLLVNFIFIFISLLLTIILLYKYFNIDFKNSLFMFLSTIFIYIGHGLLSLEFDFMNKQNDQYQFIGDTMDNPNEKKSIINAFILSFIFFIFYLFLIVENYNEAWIKVLILSFTYLLFRLYLFNLKADTCFKEV